MAREGLHTRVSTYVAILGLLVTYLIPAFQQGWWPFPKDIEITQDATPASPTTVSPTTRPDVPKVNETSQLPTTTTDTAESGELADFVIDYYDMMPDMTAGWEFIGDDLRLRGRDSYELHWSKYDGVEVQGPPQVAGHFVTVDIFLYHGGSIVAESHVLGIVSCRGHLCIDSDKLVST